MKLKVNVYNEMNCVFNIRVINVLHVGLNSDRQSNAKLLNLDMICGTIAKNHFLPRLLPCIDLTYN